MQAERLGVKIEVFLCAVCRHRQVVVAVDTRHGHLLPEVWLSPRRFLHRTRLRSSHTNYFLLVVTCEKSRIQYRSLGLLARPLLVSCEGAVQAQRKDFFPLTQWSTTPSNPQRRTTKADPHMIVSAID